jgi:hypothetical protein
VGVSEESCELTTEECERDAAVSPIEILGSDSRTSVATQHESTEAPLAYAPTGLGKLAIAPDDWPDEQQGLLNLGIRAEPLTRTSAIIPTSIQNLLTSVRAAVRDRNKQSQEDNKQLQESNVLFQKNVSSQTNSLQEGNKQLKERVEAKLKELEQSNANPLKNVCTYIQSENTKLIK